jgi:hypothetical protein
LIVFIESILMKLMSESLLMKKYKRSMISRLRRMKEELRRKKSLMLIKIDWKH